MLFQTSSSKKSPVLEVIISSALRQIILWFILTCATTHYVFVACLLLVCTNRVTQRYSVATKFVPNVSSTMIPVKQKKQVCHLACPFVAVIFCLMQNGATSLRIPSSTSVCVMGLFENEPIFRS